MNRFRNAQRTVFCFLLAVMAAAGSTLAAVAPGPRLILTPRRIEALKAARDPMQRELWQLARESADQFSRQPIPAMRDANNRWRTFGDTLPALGLAYWMTGDKAYVEAADRWLEAFLAVPEWRGSQNLGRSAWVVGSALSLDWLRDALPESTKARVSERLVAEGEILLGKGSEHRLLSNHCLIETSALGMIGLALQDLHPRAGAFLQRAQERADDIIARAPLDGSWGEGVQYWQYGLGYFLRYLEASKTTGVRDYYARYEWLKKAGFFPIQFSVPGRPAETVNISDSGTHDYMAAFLLYLTASVYRNGYYQDYGNRTRSPRPYKLSWMDFITYDPTVRPADFTTLPAFHHFEDNGFVMMRSGWKAGDTLVAFHCGASPGQRNQADPRRVELHGFGPGHAHPDINGFSFFARGEWLVLDPGYVHQKWTHDENTLVVNGRGQAGEGHEWLDYMEFQAREPAPRILRAETHPEFDYVIGDAGNIYVDEAGVRHFRRHLLFLKPSTVVVLDDVATRPDSRIEWLLQAGEGAAQLAPDLFEISRNGIRLAVQPLLPLRHEARIVTRDLRASGTKGQVTTLTLAANSPGRATFLVVLDVLPDAGATTPRVQFREDMLEIRSAQRTVRIRVTDPSASRDPAEPLLTVK